MNIKVFGELLFEMLERDPNNTLLDHIIICIYGLLKKHIISLVSNYENKQGIYNDIKSLIFECVKKRYLGLENPTNIMRKNICDCISILIITGISSSWESCISDLINEAKTGAPELTFIAIRSIADCDLIMNFFNNENDDEYWDDKLDFQNQEKDKIKKMLIGNTDLIFNFIYNEVYSNINKFENNLKIRIIKSIIDLINFWTKLNLNVLTDRNVYKIIMDLINMIDDQNEKIENIKNVAELISKSIVSSTNCKLYEFYSKADENSNIEEVLRSINDNVDIEEKNGIDMYLEYLLKIFDEYAKSNVKNENLLWAYAKIFSSIIENYAYFFFDFNNQRNGTIFHWLKYFLTHSKRKISWMFFNSIESIMNFITDYYRFYGLNNNQIDEFTNYLIDIFFGIMKNCEHKKLNPKDFSQLQKEILYKSDDSNWTLVNNNYFNNFNEDLDMEDIDLEEYRTAAESAFFDIYSIFKYGLNEKYEECFIKKIISLIDLENQNFGNNFNESIAKKLDIILLVFKSITKGINVESSKNIIELINKFIFCLTDSIYIQNINIFMDYLIFINQFGKCLVLNKTYFEKAVLILLSISDKTNIEQSLIDSCYIVLSNICSELNENSSFENIFNVFYQRFTKIYGNYNHKNIKPLESLINSMFSVIGINRFNFSENSNQDNLIPYIQKIFEPTMNDIHLLIGNINNFPVENVISGIIKTYALYKELFYNISICNDSLKRQFTIDFISNTNNDLINIFKAFPNNMEVFTSIIKFYINIGNMIGEYCLSNFTLLNDIFVELFKVNNNYFQIIDLFCIIYNKILNTISENSQNYLQQNKYISNNFFILINYSIQHLRTKAELNHEVLSQIKYFITFINDVFPLINIPDEQEAKETVQQIILTINFIISITNLINDNRNELIKDNIISMVFKSISSLLNEKILFYISSNSTEKEYKNFIKDIVINTYKLLYMKEFGFLSGQELSKLYFSIIKSKHQIFIDIFCELLKSRESFTNDYIINIYNYIAFFNNDKDSIIQFINEILSIFKENKSPDCLEFYFNRLNRKKN